MDVKKVEEFALSKLSSELDSNFMFHDLDRAKNLISKSIEILNTDGNNADRENTLIAAWFLYLGFTKDYKEHVRHSQNMARSFLEKNSVTNEQIAFITGLIASAWNDLEPESKEAEILKDVRTSHYGSDNFIELIELQRLELLNVIGDAPSSFEFKENFLEILNGVHRFYTNYGNENWHEQKKKNILSLVGKSLKAERTEKKEKLKVKLKNQSPERAIQSLYRTQLRNHIKLSDIADTKANILLSVNAIIISLLLANLIPKLDSPRNSYLIYPTVIFVVFSITSMIMSVLATRPKIENNDLIDSDLNSENTNFLFFGTFHSLSIQDFKRKMKNIIKSKESIYDSLTMDLYYLGLVLKKKYQLLRWTYTVFIIGIVLSVIAFGVALKYYGMDKEILEAVTPE
ncbi:MAG: Pycsar system effector family protein [Pricia sp.]